jgi:hypothetical protein
MLFNKTHKAYENGPLEIIHQLADCFEGAIYFKKSNQLCSEVKRKIVRKCTLHVFIQPLKNGTHSIFAEAKMKVNIRTLFFGGLLVLILGGLVMYSSLPHPAIVISQHAQAYIADVNPLPTGKLISFQYDGGYYQISYRCSGQRNTFILWKSNSLIKYGQYPCTTDGLAKFIEYLKSLNPIPGFSEVMDKAVAAFIQELP